MQTEDLILIKGSEINRSILSRVTVDFLIENLIKAFPNYYFGIGTYHEYKYDYYVYDFVIQCWTKEMAEKNPNDCEMLCCSIKDDYGRFQFALNEHPFYHNPKPI